MNPALLPLGMFGRATQPGPVLQKPSFFGQGGTGRAIAGNIGDFLLQQAGARPIYAPAMQAQHQAALQQAQAEQQRQAGLIDWMAKEKWKRENPEPVNNDTIADYDFRVRTLGKEAADTWLSRSGDPIVNTTLPGNRFYSGPASGLADALRGTGAAAPAAPQAPVGKLTPIAGGASPAGSRTFP